ncbi:polysaccharide deacetylase family protein [Clostridium sp. Mt-5]|uniref:Polysaccharide deacetylase family protein n=1 Tax=Clostridium moutaii TaxID=3240932 RepID=A0ABV4BPJ5_9CLOT
MKLNIFSLVLSYAILPSLYYRDFSNKIIKKVPSNGNKSIALTFDDGPDPQYTPKLLDILKINNLKCTFFVLAENAQKYPDIIKRIKNEGHCIGLHSLKHGNPIFSLPYQTKKSFVTALNIMDNLGVNIKFFRPPWGIFNPLTYHYAKSNNLKIILWSMHARDWSKWATEDYIKQKIINDIKPGDIILLHDGSRGMNNFPENTIKALKTILPILKKRGFQFIVANDLFEF